MHNWTFYLKKTNSYCKIILLDTAFIYCCCFGALVIFLLIICGPSLTFTFPIQSLLYSMAAILWQALGAFRL